jgi:hypothetical protein
MAKIVGENEWSKIGSKNGSPYFVVKEESGTVILKIKGPHVYVEMGDKDSIGRQWQKNWTKNEVLVDVDGDQLEDQEKGEKVLLLGGNKSPLKRYFIEAWQAAGLKPTTIKGSVWKVTKTDTYEYDIINITDNDSNVAEEEVPAKEVEAEAPKEIKDAPAKEVKAKTSTEKIKQIVEIAQEMRNEAELQEGMETADFITAVGFRGEVSMEDIEKNLSTLERKKIIVLKDGIVTAA